jgi:hypothetical protein
MIEKLYKDPFMAEQVEQLTYCEVHPDRETSLRCNKCGRLMCPDCAVPTPVGYRCKQCVRKHDDKFFTAGQNDYIIIAAACAITSAIVAAIIQQIALPALLLIFIAIPAGGAVAELALRLTGRRRGRQTANIALTSIILGGIIGALIDVVMHYGRLPSMNVLFAILIADFRLPIMIGIMAFFAYSRFRGRA